VCRQTGPNDRRDGAAEFYGKRWPGLDEKAQFGVDFGPICRVKRNCTAFCSAGFEKCCFLGVFWGRSIPVLSALACCPWF